MNERKTELDVIRVIACFLVVVIHVATYGIEAMDPMSTNWMIRNLVTCMVRCAVPIFFMLSGVLFLEKEISIKILYKKYIARLLIAWGFWSALYAVIDYIAYRKTGMASVRYFMSQFLKGHYHMWFLAALLTAYIFLPILQELVKSCPEDYMRYMGLIIFIFVIGRETLEPFFKGDMTWDTVWNNLNMLGNSKSVIYFVLGYYLYKNKNLFSAKIYMVMYGLSVIVMAGINAIWAYRSGASSPVLSGYLTLGVLLSASALFMLLLQKFSQKQFSTTCSKGICKMSECTFGIYLVHTLFIEQVYRRIGLIQDNFPSIISIILFSVLTFFLSLVTAWCLRKIPVIGKLIA